MVYREISPELEERAKKEVNEDPKRRDEDIKHIKDWLSKQPHLRARTDDQWILSFLRGCKFSLEKTKQKLDMYYTLRSAIPELFTNRDPFSANAQKMLSSRMVLEMPQRDELGRRVTIQRPGVMAANAVPAEDSGKVSFMGADATLHADDAAVICGEVTVQDMAGCTMAHFTSWTPWQIKRFMTCFQDGYPLRPQGFHIINAPSGMEKMFSLFQSFFNEKFKKRFFVHPDLASLHKHVSKKVLPEEYGGEAGPIDKLPEMWRQRIENNAALLKEDEKFGVDESKRPGKPKTQADLFGVEGSFRQLSVD